jgi:hypothetical protein
MLKIRIVGWLNSAGGFECELSCELIDVLLRSRYEGVMESEAQGETMLNPVFSAEEQDFILFRIKKLLSLRIHYANGMIMTKRACLLLLPEPSHTDVGFGASE